MGGSFSAADLQRENLSYSDLGKVQVSLSRMSAVLASSPGAERRIDGKVKGGSLRHRIAIRQVVRRHWAVRDHKKLRRLIFRVAQIVCIVLATDMSGKSWNLASRKDKRAKLLRQCDQPISWSWRQRFSVGAVFLSSIGLACSADVPVAKKTERWAVPSWGDVVCVYGPGTDASMDSPEAIEKTIKRWIARGYTGVTLRSDLADYEPMIHRNMSTQQNPRLQLLLDYVDHVSLEFNVLSTAEKISKPLGFEMWAWHPHIYSDGATKDIGTPGLGRMIPWSYSSQYFIDHPEGLTVDRKGNKLWMVREYAYPEARSTKVSEFVHMAKTLGVKRFIACMRSEVNQLVDPPDKGDQYGFNRPVADEMKKRYGVDIMTDPRFDAFSPDFKINDPMVENWRKLRGEHITQFYRELRQALDAVDPKIQIAATVSGDYAGPPIGNQVLDWRKWVDDGLVDAIITPVFFEATLDHEAGKKGYLTHVREGVGIVSAQTYKDYIKKSAHPEIQVINTGATAYFDEPPPAGADGWRADVWYELYTSAWYQRWSQWMQDVEDTGHIRFIDQNFDSFPTDPAKLSPAGAMGMVAYNPKLRACPGGWYAFGSEESGLPFIQDKVRHGEQGNAVQLTSNGAEGPVLIGYHASEADRSNISAVLDTAITNGACDYSFWIYRPEDGSGMSSYLEYRGEDLDIGVKVDPATGLVSYATGRSSAGAAWKATDHNVPVGVWQRFVLSVDFATDSYAVSVGDKGETSLAKGIPYSKPKPRTTMQNGVNLEIAVPSYKTLRQVAVRPLGAKGSKVYVDDISVLWKPDLGFQPTGSEVVFADTFEQNAVSADLNGLPGQVGQWTTTPNNVTDAFSVISSTSYREGTHSLLASRRGDLRPTPAKPVVLTKGGALTFDTDLFIRSNSGYPSIIPAQTFSSDNVVRMILETAGEKPETLISAEAANGKWTLQSGKNAVLSEISVPYDCWMQVQLSVDLAAGTCSLVQQQIGQVAQKLATAPLPENFKPGQPLAFRINMGPKNECVILDNVKISVSGENQVAAR